MPTVSKGIDTNFNPKFGDPLNKLIAEVEAKGGHVVINSGYRSVEHQREILKNPGKYGVAPGTPIAQPGSSDHNYGFAADLGGDDRTMGLLKTLAPKYGISNNVGNDPNHFFISRDPEAPGTYSPGVDLAAGAVSLPLVDRLAALASLFTPGGVRPDTSVNTSATFGTGPTEPETPEATANPLAAGTSTGGGGQAAGDFADLFNQAGAKYGVDPRLLSTIARFESGYNPKAKSGAGALGLMQFMPGTAKSYGIDPMDPAQAVDGAARMMRDLIKRFGSTDLALAAYNAGPGAVEKYGGIPPFNETKAYVSKIMGALNG